MGGDEHTVRLGQRGELQADPFGESSQAGLEILGIRFVGGLACGIGGDESVTDLSRYGLDI